MYVTLDTPLEKLRELAACLRLHLCFEELDRPGDYVAQRVKFFLRDSASTNFELVWAIGQAQVYFESREPLARRATELQDIRFFRTELPESLRVTLQERRCEDDTLQAEIRETERLYVSYWGQLDDLTQQAKAVRQNPDFWRLPKTEREVLAHPGFFGLDTLARAVCFATTYFHERRQRLLPARLETNFVSPQTLVRSAS